MNVHALPKRTNAGIACIHLSYQAIVRLEMISHLEFP